MLGYDVQRLVLWGTVKNGVVVVVGGVVRVVCAADVGVVVVDDDNVWRVLPVAVWGTRKTMLVVSGRHLSPYLRLISEGGAKPLMLPLPTRRYGQ